MQVKFSSLRAALVLLSVYSTFRTVVEAQIPISLLYKMKDVSTAEDFALLFGNRVGKPGGKPEKPTLHGTDEEAVDPYEGIAEFGKCEPRPVPIGIPRDHGDPNVYYWPPCVDLHRCGGCCSDLFECVAKETEVVDIKVWQAVYDHKSPDKLPIHKVKTFPMLNETECECGCRTKKEDCDPNIHIHDQCTCMCRNTNQACPPLFRWSNKICQCVCAASETKRSQCIWDNRKVWNEENCTCGCKRVRYCPNEKAWDEEKCKCVAIKDNCSPKKCTSENETFNPKSCRCEHKLRLHPHPAGSFYTEGGIDNKKELA